MSRWRINIFCIIAAPLLFSFCGKDGDGNVCGYIPGFMDLRPVGMTIIPGKANALLPEEYSPVILGFDTDMKKEETEGILQINSDSGSVTGDRFWKGRKLYFVPSPPWTAGTRYVLNISGIACSLDGRELTIERYIPFFAINKSEPPLLKEFSPADGASVENSGLVIRLSFSCPMEKLSVESAFVIEGINDKKFEWSDDDKILDITPEKILLPWTVYHWTLKGGAKSRDGVPLAKEVSGRFSTDLDRLLPRVTGVFPVILSGGHWLSTGGLIERDLGPGQGIAVTFNKAMGDNALRSIRFEPSLSGRTEALSEKSVVFIPGKDPEPETAYTLIVSADAKDTGGLKMGTDHRVTFIPDIPFINIISLDVDGLPSLNAAGGLRFDGTSVFGVPLDLTVLRFSIRFSLPFSAEAKKDAAKKISLSPYFPGTLDPIALRSVKWISDDRIRMEWERLKTGNADEVCHYKLSVPGGRGGINNGGGMYFREDQILYLETMP
jgi:hypothetical protein